METINASDFKARCLALLDQVQETGERIVILKRGRSVAELCTPHSPRAGRPHDGVEGHRHLARRHRRAGGSRRAVRKPEAMNVLLDTHVLIWWFDDHDRLSQAREKGILLSSSSETSGLRLLSNG